jgi:hypothetical protein
MIPFSLIFFTAIAAFCLSRTIQCIRKANIIVRWDTDPKEMMTAIGNGIIGAIYFIGAFIILAIVWS